MSATDKKEGKHIFLVEDDTFLSDIYQKKFAMEGFKISAVDNGEKALSEIKKKKPDVILLDVLLPKLDGFSVLQKLKEDDEVKGIPVILLTNLGQKDDVDKGLKMGAADYLIKVHFKPSEVVEKVKKVLGI